MNFWVEFFLTGAFWISAFYAVQLTSDMVTTMQENKREDLRREADDRAEKIKKDIIQSLNEKRE